MAEVLLRVVDKVNPNSVYLDAQCLKRGDVVVVCPDGWNWGTEELSNPHWRILKLPNIPVEQMQQFLSEEPETDPANPSRTRQRRGFKFNVDGATGALRTYLRDETRAQPTFTSSLSLTQVERMRVRKMAIPDPNVI